ncbi:MAG: hypothetical protein D6722_06250 [Bacteroidetes bacterium]|nr:MAG: hypothetical protein D6722_06250 [Bacteroidota bacterium]
MSLLTFRTFGDLLEARETLRLLEQADIPFVVEDLNADFDPFFAFNKVGAKVFIKVAQSDFPRARQALLRAAALYQGRVSPEHYLHDFSREELREVVYRQDEWSVEDVLMAQQLLRERGEEMDEAALAAAWQARLQEIRQPQAGDREGLRIGWLLSLIGGLLGVFIGYNYWQLRKYDPEGQPFWVYDAATRRQGHYMMYLGLGMSLLWMGLGIWSLTA